MKQMLYFLLGICFMINLSACHKDDEICETTTQIHDNSLAYVDNTFPKLTTLFSEELSNAHTHYIFAIDVSGSMNQYKDLVCNSLNTFINALPDNDKVDIIPFGTKTYENSPNYQGVINQDVKMALSYNLNRLYDDPSYPEDFKSYTDIPQAIGAISNVITNNRDFFINVVVVMTDFRNDVQGSTPTERQLTTEEISHLRDHMLAATNESYTRCIALELPVDQSAPGYCLPTLKNKVFPTERNGLEIVTIANPSSMIGQWFDQLKREITVSTLRAIVELENIANKSNFDVSVRQNGKVKVKINFRPSKLYPSMRIDSSYVKQEGFSFVNNSKIQKIITDTNESVKIGEIKYRHWGLHHFQDSLYLGLSFPTDYDDELASLNICKPIDNSQVYVDKTIFTFFLPLWLVIIIVGVLGFILLGLMVSRIKAKKYSKWIDIQIHDNNTSSQKLLTEELKGSIIIGRSGTGERHLDNANWSLSISRKTNRLYQRPTIFWKELEGDVTDCQSHKNSGHFKDSVTLSCGYTHKDSSKKGLAHLFSRKKHYTTHNITIKTKKLTWMEDLEIKLKKL